MKNLALCLLQATVAELEQYLPSIQSCETYALGASGLIAWSLPLIGIRINFVLLQMFMQVFNLVCYGHHVISEVFKEDDTAALSDSEWIGNIAVSHWRMKLNNLLRALEFFDAS